MTTVLFIHGLESGPHGRKRRALEAAGYTVVAAQMPCGRRGALRDPVVLCLAVAVLAGTLAAIVHAGAMGLLLAAVSIASTQGFVRSRLIRRMVRRSLAVQARALAAQPVDVVLGSSFGGAVALELVALGLWRGPTVLLCPAHRLVAAHAWRAPRALPEAAARIVVVHGRQDETVPIEHSRALVKGSAAALLEVDDGHRLEATATPANLRAWIARAQA